ncbi:hypothetical protein PHMEG_00016413 [Phytophthora megakarya]|uniref:Jacalin-type lectin domain-containing protein n=1 Tax=Phytophthora megakarya TaxID=4795 RepID=A0A225W0G3_9STRA|nr:hypothetical protein PHMEG_00016413 [Phytophthora megakarya]
MRLLHLVLAIGVAFAWKTKKRHLKKEEEQREEVEGVEEVEEDVEAVEEGVELPLEVVELEAVELELDTIDQWPEDMGPEAMISMSPLNCLRVLTLVVSINLRADERVDAVILTVVSPSNEEVTLFHGGNGGNLKTPLVLAEGEYITFMEAHAGKHKDRTRVKYIKFTTNKGNFIEGGTQCWNGHC